MNQTTKNNLPLILGLSIPLVMIAIIAAFIYIPAWKAPKPQYNFLYMVPEEGYYPYTQEYVVENSHVVKHEVLPDQTENFPKPVSTGIVRFFVQDVTANQSKEISYEEATKLTVNSNIQSPDGYEVTSSSGGDMFFFGSSYDNRSKYLKGHGTAIKTTVTIPNNSYDFRFLGWTE